MLMTRAAGQASSPPSTEVGDRRDAVRTLWGACIGMLLNVSALLPLSFGIYMLPILKDTGWDRTVIASSIGPAMLMVSLSPPLLGRLLNRFGPRRFLAIGFPLCGAALMLLATPTSAASFAWTMALVGALSVGQTSIAYICCISGWFDQRRGMALGLILACTGLGVAIIPALAGQLIGILGWRNTYVAFGGAVVVIGVAVAKWLIVDPPVVAAADRDRVPGLTVKEALKMRSFWLLFFSILLVGTAVSAGTANLNVLLVERGVAAERASLVMGLVGVSMIVARLVFGFLLDKVRAQWLTTFVCLLVGSAFVVLAATDGPGGVMAAAVLIGIGFGAEGDALSYMTSRAYGMRHFAAIFGIVFLAYTGGGAAGPVVFAMMRGVYGDYQMALWLAAALCGVSALLVYMIRDRDLPYGRKPG